MASRLHARGHTAWTAWQAQIHELSDQEVIVYADDHDAVVVTSNKDFIPVARRLRYASVVYLRVTEAHAVAAIDRAVDWLGSNHLPKGMVLRVPLKAEIKVLSPLPWRSAT